jgi:hypothetical protein
LDKGEKLKPTSNPFNSNNAFGGCWYNVVDSWSEAVLNLNVKPVVAADGDFISGIKD